MKCNQPLVCKILYACIHQLFYEPKLKAQEESLLLNDNEARRGDTMQKEQDVPAMPHTVLRHLQSDMLRLGTNHGGCTVLPLMTFLGTSMGEHPTFSQYTAPIQRHKYTEALPFAKARILADVVLRKGGTDDHIKAGVIRTDVYFQTGFNLEELDEPAMVKKDSQAVLMTT